MINQVLAGRYEILENIGGGGMADVYRAHDTVLDRTVAIKILHSQLSNDAEFIDKFHREAKGAGKLNHPNIVNIYDVGEDAGNHFIVMEYVAGDTLKNYIRKRGKLEPDEVLRISIDIARALEAAHTNGLIHCDVKPHNILINDSGNVKVADFGIARAVTASTMTYGGNVIGSVHYFSPEQAKGTVITPKSDVYSLGICMYEMLTGELPFNGETSVSIALKHLQENAVPIQDLCPSVPQVVVAIVQKAMAKNPAVRPSSTELIVDMTEALSMITYRKNGTSSDDKFATQVLPRVTDEPIPSPRREQSLEPSSANSRVVYAEQEENPPFIKSKKFMISLVLILLVGFGVGAFVSYGKFWSSSELEVPNVVGRQTAIAQQMLEEKNLRVTIAETFDANVPEGQVVSQYPESGTMVKEQRNVTIYISKGGEELTMPDLKGMSKENAKTKLEKMGLTVVIYEENASAEAGTVIKQEISAGSKVSKGKSVDIIVSKGEKKKTLNLQDYSGMTVDSAKNNILANGLNLGSVSEKASDKPKGTIIGQNPSAGSSVQVGQSIDLIISEGPAPKVVPAETKKDKRAEDTAEAQEANSQTSTTPPTVNSKESKKQ